MELEQWVVEDTEVEWLNNKMVALELEEVELFVWKYDWPSWQAYLFS